MSDLAIQTESLGKRYHVSRAKNRYTTLREELTALIHPKSWSRRRRPPSSRYAWALSDVSFQVAAGEVVGLIGANGAGKSTLLKILSRVTAPTTGTATVRGRVGSLLEAGVGFHPELSGRENIYLSGILLGMRRAEVDQRLSAIVDFSGVGPHLETPVKRYSTGMHLRLGFAVSAHLHPEILLVDEVLAVGDAAFQNRCLKKIADVAREGRTVLVVSHNMAVIRRLAPRALVLGGGKLLFDGPAREAIEYYLGAQRQVPGTGWLGEQTPRWGTGEARVIRLRALDQDGRPTMDVGAGEPFYLELDIEARRNLECFVAGIDLRTHAGDPLCCLRSDSHGVTFARAKPGERRRLRVLVPGLPFIPGPYSCGAWLKPVYGDKADHVENALNINLQSRGVYAAESRIRANAGPLLIDATWSAPNQKNLQVMAHSAQTGGRFQAHAGSSG